MPMKKSLLKFTDVASREVLTAGANFGLVGMEGLVTKLGGAAATPPTLHPRTNGKTSIITRRKNTITMRQNMCMLIPRKNLTGVSIRITILL